MKETLRTVGICFGCLIAAKVLKGVLMTTLPTVNAGDQIMAGDHNGVVNQVNTDGTNIASNTSTLASHTSTLATHSSQIATLQGGPTFSGAISAPGINLTTGSISRIWVSGSVSVGTGGTSVSHGLGVTPDFVAGILDEGAAGTNVVGVNYGGMGSSSFTAYCSVASANCRFLAIKF